MSARTPREAADAFLQPLRRAIACVTDAYLAGGYESGKEHGLIFRPAADGAVVLSGDTPIRFRLLHLYHVTEEEGGWAVHTTGYSYGFELTDGQEIVTYHYDPRDQSKVKTPHLHVRGLNQPLSLGKAHFPTGRVSIEEVLRFAINELGVRPRVTDWERVLDETERQFFSKKKW